MTRPSLRLLALLGLLCGGAMGQGGPYPPAGVPPPTGLAGPPPLPPPTGPSGPAPFPPFPPYPPYPPPGLLGPGPFGWPGPFPLTPVCVALESLRYRLHTVAEPVVLGGAVLLGLWLFKKFLAPHFSVLTEFRSRQLDELTAAVSDAVSSTVCLERIACRVGRSARSLAPAPVFNKFIGKILGKDYHPLVKIFKQAALKESLNCDAFACSSTTQKKE